MFMSDEDIEKLTGKKQKSQQIAQLRKMGIPFFINASGHPVVTVAAVEGKSTQSKKTEKTWTPKWAGSLA